MVTAVSEIPLIDEAEAQRRARRDDPALAPLWALLDKVVDPEIPVLTLWDLGVLRDIRVDGDVVEVVLTPTYVGCPALSTMAEDVRNVLAGAGYTVRIVNSLSPAWSSDWISAQGRRKLRDYGIAPPAGYVGRPQSPIRCPHCGSEQVEQISEFGSTACKALYRCCDCAEPFDYFKCI